MGNYDRREPHSLHAWRAEADLSLERSRRRRAEDDALIARGRRTATFLMGAAGAVIALAILIALKVVLMS